jgi:hypothetical protein
VKGYGDEGTGKTIKKKHRVKEEENMDNYHKDAEKI